MWLYLRKGGKLFQASTLRQILLMTGIVFWFVCLFILKGEEEEVVYRNQRFKGTIETTASVVKRELIAIPYFLRFPV